MKESVLIVVDMQNDFVTGSLGTKEAERIVPAVLNKVRNFPGRVLFTRDTHAPEYLETQEGRNLPVLHCVRGTEGWQLIGELEEWREEHGALVYDKNTFGSTELACDLEKENREHGIQSIELIGLCTDICVVSNALMIKAFLPEVPMTVDAACCAGVTPESHNAALRTMASCQIAVENH